MGVTVLFVGVSDREREDFLPVLEGHDILIASDGEEATAILEDLQGAILVLLDMGLPGEGALRVLESIKAEGQHKRTRTVMLADSQYPEDEIEGLRRGADDYLRKPIRLESVRARLELNLELLEEKANLLRLEESNLIYSSIYQQAPIGIVISYQADSDSSEGNEFVGINPMFEKITGRTKADLITLGWASITHPDDLEEDLKHYKALVLGDIDHYSMEKRFIKPDGTIVWVNMVVSPLRLANQPRHTHIALLQDITERKEAEKALAESERSKSVLLANLPGMAYSCRNERGWTMLFVSAGCMELTGYPPDSLIGSRDISFNEIIAPEYREALWNEWTEVLAQRKPFRFEYEIITAKGERKWVLEIGEGVYNEQGGAETLEGIILDISERKRIEDSLRYRNEHDVWTGLYNRSYLENTLRKELRAADSAKRALISINLSLMHLLSVTYGFQYGQELIRRVADALKLLCSSKRSLFNTYEYRFVLYVSDYADKKELTEFCEEISATIDAVLSVEKVSVGIGVVEIDATNRNDVDKLLKDLLITSEKATESSEDDINICFFDKAMEEGIHREEVITRELTQVAAGRDEDRLFLQFQPILNLSPERICGFEALARFRSAELGLVSPLEFIPIAEKTKLMLPLGNLIIRRAFGFLGSLRQRGYDSVAVSINISAIQLLRVDFIANLSRTMEEMGVDPGNVALEITESVFASNYQHINSIICELRSLGMSIAMDDFGTGYSSLAREREMKVNCIKIDKYFIDKLLEFEEDEAITSDIISMAHKQGHCVVAEGVEQEVQRQYLLRNGCDRIQGYLISRPLGEEAALELLKDSVGTSTDCTSYSCRWAKKEEDCGCV